MLSDTYHGRKLRVKKGREWGTLDGFVNGHSKMTAYGRAGVDEARLLASLRTEIDFIDREPVNGDRWGAEWYAPGTYTMCGEGLHPVALGGECQHFTCIRRRAAA